MLAVTTSAVYDGDTPADFCSLLGLLSGRLGGQRARRRLVVPSVLQDPYHPTHLQLARPQGLRLVSRQQQLGLRDAELARRRFGDGSTPAPVTGMA